MSAIPSTDPHDHGHAHDGHDHGHDHGRRPGAAPAVSLLRMSLAGRLAVAAGLILVILAALRLAHL